MNTIGIVFVAAIAAWIATLPAPAQMTATLRLTRSCRHGRQPVKLAFRPAVFDGDVAALCEARLSQATVKSSHAVRPLR